jgi:hypothetical protein
MSRPQWRKAVYPLAGLLVAGAVAWGSSIAYLQSDLTGSWIFTFREEKINTSPFLDFSLEVGVDGGQIVRGGEVQMQGKQWWVVGSGATTSGSGTTSTNSELRLQNSAEGDVAGTIALQDAPAGQGASNFWVISIGSPLTANMMTSKRQIIGLSPKFTGNDSGASELAGLTFGDNSWEDNLGFGGSFTAIKLSDDPSTKGGNESPGCFLSALRDKTNKRP